MIKIRKGDVVITVSNAAYKDMFKNIGYEIVEEGTKKQVPSKKQENKSSDDTKLDILDKEETNLSTDEENSFKIENEEDEDIVVDKNNNLENILDILSDNSKETKKNNRQSKKNKEE